MIPMVFLNFYYCPSYLVCTINLTKTGGNLKGIKTKIDGNQKTEIEKKRVMGGI